ncbi:hypothetical protein [Flavobacterium nackdongense]|uniref:T9SS sorting signal type C domain-containing protein n=1 Tax=Flavobacterium nackdongense TaxID=2547394 RepID=A0A4V1AH63_9FLAO|nr:hypothetical protein [Flavobacterium nackdongense]QBN20442.1 hypothetical protein E1750_17140 [Flavobacterium nackdongense]
MRTKNYLKVILFLSFLSFYSNAQVVNTTLDPTVRDKANLDIGFNRRSDSGIWWTDASFKNLVAEMNPDVVRYPAGTQANYWDWRTGKFIDNTDKTWGANTEVLKIPQFVSVLPNRTKIIYVVNMARPTPITGVDVNASEATLKSTSTLDLKITDMLAALAEFGAQGKLPFAIELGNEFYFGNTESGIYEITQVGSIYYGGWDAANSKPFQANSKKDATVFIANLYLEQCNRVVAAIKAQYPNMKFALCTTKLEANAQAREVWNNTIFDGLNTNPNYTALKNSIYAVTQHHYLNDTYGDQTIINTNATAKVAIAEGIQYPIDSQADYNLVPSNYKIWFTEYGVTKTNADLTWASGVRYAALVQSWITRGDKVGQLDYHYISDSNVVQPSNPMKLAPIGIAAKLVAKASADMTEMQEINFGTNPISVNGVKSLYGYKFKNNKKETLLLINTSDTNFTQVQFSNLFTSSSQPKMTQYYSDAPYVTGVVEGNSNIVSTTGNVNNFIDIRNFSVTVVEVDIQTFYYDGSGPLTTLTNWGSNADGTGTNPSNFTANGQTFIIRNTTAVTTTAPWTVSGTNSKIVVGDSSQPGLSLTVANTFPITGTIDVTAASSAVNSLVLQTTTLPTFGTLDSTSEVHFQAASSTYVINATFGKIFFENNSSFTVTTPFVVQTSLNVSSGSTLNINNTSYCYLNSGATAAIAGTFRTARASGFVAFGIASPNTTNPPVQFQGAEIAGTSLILAGSTIEYFRSGNLSAQTISPRTDYANLSINDGSGGFNIKTISAPVTVSGKLTLNLINAGSSLVTNGFLTLKSTATQTAVVAPVVGTINGNVIVERYIPAGFRAYRLLSSPVTTSTSIQANWQENSLNANPNPGYGTHITGGGGNVNGFDATTSNAPSLFTHNNTGAPASWSAMTTTAGTLAAGLPYLIYIRGSRQATNIMTLGNDATTLRATGALKIGTVAVPNLNATANGFSAIGNPYQAQVDMQAVLSTSTNLNTSFYYVLEPKMGTKGQYVTVNVATNTNTGGSTANRYLQPWQGAFVKTVAVPTATPTLSFAENNKYDGTPQTSVFKTANTVSSLRLALYETATLAQNGYPLDGLIVDFGANESNGVNQNDAVKLTNFDENMATSNSGKLLSIERRAIPIEADQIPLSINNYKGTYYTLKIDASALTGANPYLQDSYTNTTTEIPQEGNLNYNFTVDAGVPASVASDRFKIVYAKTLGIDQTNFDSNSIVVYKDKGVFYVNSGAEVLDLITIFDIQGRKIGQHKNIKSKSYSFNAVGISPQVLIFKISTAEGKVVSKKVVN